MGGIVVRTTLACAYGSETRTHRLRSTVSHLADLREPFEPPAEPLDVRAAAREELAAEAHVETGPADDVGHKGVAGDEPAAGQSKGEGTDVEPVARAAPSLGEVAFEDCLESSLTMAFDSPALARERQTGGQLAQELEQRQVGPCSRFESMSLGLGDGDGAASDCPPQGRLELAERGLALHDPAQVVLIDVEQECGVSGAVYRRGRKPRDVRWRYAPSTSAARS
jgi:hypothetical protein